MVDQTLDSYWGSRGFPGLCNLWGLRSWGFAGSRFRAALRLTFGFRV